MDRSFYIGPLFVRLRVIKCPVGEDSCGVVCFLRKVNFVYFAFLLRMLGVIILVWCLVQSSSEMQCSFRCYCVVCVHVLYKSSKEVNVPNIYSGGY